MSATSTQKWADALYTEVMAHLPANNGAIVMVVSTLSYAVANGWAEKHPVFDESANAFFHQNQARAVGFIVAVSQAIDELAAHGSAGLDKVIGTWGN